MIPGAVTCDADTLAALYKGEGLRGPGGYDYSDFREGLENFSRFLEPYRIRATIFMIGESFLVPRNMGHIRDVVSGGHEIGNHTHTHPQGFRSLGAASKELEIRLMEDACKEVTGTRPVGFRSPGWNISDDTIPILKRRAYLYDSSVFPSSLNPLLKFLYWRRMRGRSRSERSALGAARYMFAPTDPYFVAEAGFGRRGDGCLIEFPLTVTPLARFPISATFLLSSGIECFKLQYRLLKARARPIQFQFHISDFVDFSRPVFSRQLPAANGLYVSKGLKTPLAIKWDTFKRAMDIIAGDYRFVTLRQWAERLAAGGAGVGG